jgi:hypothetical protein
MSILLAKITGNLGITSSAESGNFPRLEHGVTTPLALQ